MKTCSICHDDVPVVRSGHPKYEADGTQHCFNCDQGVMRELENNHSSVPGAQSFADNIRSYWAHPSVMSKMMSDYPGYETKSELAVVQGEGQDPRKPEDPRPNLKVVGWKQIVAVVLNHGIDSVNNGCPCDDCENDRIKTELRNRGTLPKGNHPDYSDDQIDDLHRGYYPDEN